MSIYFFKPDNNQKMFIMSIIMSKDNPKSRVITIAYVTNMSAHKPQTRGPRVFLERSAWVEGFRKIEENRDHFRNADAVQQDLAVSFVLIE